LVHLLQEFRRAEDITPDRFYENADTLRAAILGQSDPSAKAVYQATLAHLLVLNASHATAQRRDTESPQDSIREWTYQEYIHHAAMLYKQSLANMELLRQTPARQWVPLVKRKRGKQACDEGMLLVACPEGGHRQAAEGARGPSHSRHHRCHLQPARTARGGLGSPAGRHLGQRDTERAQEADGVA